MRPNDENLTCADVQLEIHNLSELWRRLLDDMPAEPDFWSFLEITWIENDLKYYRSLLEQICD